MYWLLIVLLIISGLALIVSILMQSGKQAGLSGSIGGGAEQLFGKQKGRSLDAMFERITKIAAIVFMVSAVLLVVIERFL
ncbi:MAG TPA: preprotein translocase subunit SecG [Tissierellia bacterium]|nr:preprotein translocase subunit SecG [Tissierellia bacterium]